jgi:hypothetical protein
LNTSLASWAELRHDCILYGEQPMVAECGGGDDYPPDPIVFGYVEPNLNFWTKLEELINLTRDMLKRNDLLTRDLEQKCETLQNYARFLIDVTKKELNKKPLPESDFRTIEGIGSSVEWFTLSVVDPDLYLDNWSLVEGPDRSIAQVADIFTRNVPGCSKNGILHVAAGRPKNIYVVVEINGYLRLTRGSTFSYYEFVQPLGTRLTDEEWQDMEESSPPPVPEWMKTIIINDGPEPETNERIFYSSGC